MTPVHRSVAVVAIVRNGWSSSFGMTGRHQSEQVLAITRCAQQITLTPSLNGNRLRVHLEMAGLMAHMRNVLKAGMGRFLVLGLAFIVISQGPMAHLASAHSIAGCHEDAGKMDGALHDHSAGHSHDDAHSIHEASTSSAPLVDFDHDHELECFSSMCTSALGTPSVSLFKYFPERQRSVPLNVMVPMGSHAFGLERPPKSQL